MTDPEDRKASTPAGSEDSSELLQVAADLLLPTLRGLDMLRFAARHIHPPHLQALGTAVSPAAEPIRNALPAFRAASWPKQLRELRDGTLTAAEIAASALDEFAAAAASGDMRAARRALDRRARGCETLWPSVPISPVIGRFFLDDAAREDEGLCACLEAAETPEGGGIQHVDNDSGSRGGYSVFVPEGHDPEAPPALVVALHGGEGHGRSFFWSWLPAARAAGVMLISPTSVGRTWALQGDDVDTPNIARILEEVGQSRRADQSRLLLTGMSDGGTFCWTPGLLGDSAFTHLAPFSATFHPLLLEFAEPDRLSGLPVHIVHGALDWMFPAEVARSAARALEARGARVVHREMPDLSHTFASDEAPAVIRWFLGTAARGR